jgi:hypothetical protein
MSSRRLEWILALLLCLVSAPTAFGATGQAPPVSITVVGTQFSAHLEDGSSLPQARLVGSVVTVGDSMGNQRKLKIEAVEPDPRDADGEIMLYTLSEQQVEGGTWNNICMPDPDGRQLGFPLMGSFSKEMRYEPASNGIAILCTAGAEGKCIRLGYKPWKTTKSGISLAPYYQTCLRLVRADYSGDGKGHTRDGMPIDIFDKIGIQKDEAAPGMTLEAVWGPEGARCVRHTRLANDPALDAMRHEMPALSGQIGANCTEKHYGLLFNRSFGP